jgi:hypothetical protein
MAFFLLNVNTHHMCLPFEKKVPFAKKCVNEREIESVRILCQCDIAK